MNKLKKNWYALFTLCMVLAVLASVLPVQWQFGAEVAEATDTTIQPSTDDAMVFQYAPTTNYGSGVYMLLYDGAGFVFRDLLKFSTSTIPDEATVTAATMSVYLYQYEGAADAAKEIKCKRTTSAWAESTVTWNTAPTVTDTDQATGNTIHASTGWVTFNVLALVQDAIANRSDVLSVRLSYTTETGGTSEPYFYSSEATGYEAYMPKLAVTYSYYPTVSTLAVSSISSTSATFNGNVTGIGTGNITNPAFLWDIVSRSSPAHLAPASAGYANYYIGNTSNYGVGATFSYTPVIGNLTTGLTYYVRAGGTNADGYSYGDEVTFVLPISPSLVTTLSATSITSYSATLNGNIVDLGATIHNGASLLKARFPAERYAGTNDRTYFAWTDTSIGNGTVCVNFYDHDSGLLGTPVYIGNNTDANAHNSPDIHVIPSGTYAGYILVSWGDDKNYLYVRRSSAIEDISAWSSTQTLDTVTGTYRQMIHIGDGKEALFEQHYAGSDIQTIGYRLTSDGGENWGSLVTVVNFGTNYWCYPSVKSNGNTTHIAWHIAPLGVTPYYSNAYYVYSADNLATWRTQGSSTPITLPVEVGEAEVVYTHTGTWVDDIQLDGAGSPVISLVEYVDATTGLAKWARYDSGWSVHTTGVNTVTYGNLIAYNSGVFIDPYDTTHVYIGVKSGTVSNIQEWHTTDGGTTWAKVTDITTNSPALYDEPRPVVNYNSNLKLIYNLITSWTSYTSYISTIRSYPYAIGIPQGNFTEVAFVWDSLSRGDPGNTNHASTTYAGNWGSGVVSYGQGQTFNYSGNFTFHTIYFRAGGCDSTGIWVYGNEVQLNLLVDISNTPSSHNYGVVQPNTTVWGNVADPGATIDAGECIGNTTSHSSFTLDAITAKITDFSDGTSINIVSTSPAAKEVRVTLFYAGQGSGEGLILTNAAQDFSTTVAADEEVLWELKLETGNSLTASIYTATLTFETDPAGDSETVTITFTVLGVHRRNVSVSGGGMIY